MKEGIATWVKDLSDFSGEAKLFELDPPLIDVDFWDEESVTVWKYVVVSAAVAMFSGPETYIFGADEEGHVVDWGELRGSYRGGLNIDAALNNAGYSTVVYPQRKHLVQEVKRLVERIENEL